MKIGLVLSGGAARSISHLGIIQHLEELGIKPHKISAVSGGALFGVSYCAGLTPEETLQRVMKIGSVRWFYPSTRSGGLFTLSRIEMALKEELTISTFEELTIPMVVNATDVLTGHPVYFSSGELIPAVIASCSYPAIFEPVKFNGHTLLDGGIINNFPYEPLVADCDVILGLSTGSQHPIEGVTSVQQVFIRSLGLAITEHDKNRFEHCDLILEPDGLYQYGMFDGGKGEEIFEIGYQYAKTMTDKIKRAVGL